MPLPLVVDLDGTLLRSDLLVETGMAFIRRHPFQLYKTVGWLAQGKTVLKSQLASATDIYVNVLPYNPAVLELIKIAKNENRLIVLATASHYTLAEKIAEHLQLFDLVLATNEERNLTAESKRDLLIEHFGESGFDYVGNSHDDTPVWSAARHAYVVEPERGVSRKAQAMGNVKQTLLSSVVPLKSWVSAIRIHQWMKNALIFVPLLAAHQVMNPMMVRQGILAFLLFGLCASSVYILNDLLDLADDRHHHSKKCRAAGLESGLFHRLDIIVAESGGRLYPAKDAHMSGEHFRSFYPAWEKVEALRDPALKSRFWKRVTS